jgi:hypothetical protein
MYCRVLNWMLTEVSEVRAASIIRTIDCICDISESQWELVIVSFFFLFLPLLILFFLNASFRSSIFSLYQLCSSHQCLNLFIPCPGHREAVSHGHNKWLSFDQTSTTLTASRDDTCKTLLSISVASLH